MLWPTSRNLASSNTALNESSSGGAPPPTAAVSGHWKTSLWDCFRPGPCHPSLWNAVCCPQLLVAQVLTRLKLDLCAEPTTDPQRTFPRMLGLVVAYWALTLWLAPERPPSAASDSSGAWNVARDRAGAPSSSWLRIALYNALFVVFGVYTWWILAKARRAVRRRRAIAAFSATPCDDNHNDACVALWCGCCAVAQLARETAEYDTQPASCCSRTGLTHQSAAFPAAVWTV